MNLKIIKKTDQDLYIEFVGENHTLLNLLRTELLDDDRVSIASYDVKFPIMDNPIFRLKTSGADPLEVMKEAVTRIIGQCDDFLVGYKAAVE
ncbi:MAG: DNA-directed RNA polymerase subunit L [Methanosarcinales archaeon]|nr:DNA-directed RNA polymerase subunit L [Methanosarcinales archaeon]